MNSYKYEKAHITKGYGNIEDCDLSAIAFASSNTIPIKEMDKVIRDAYTHGSGVYRATENGIENIPIEMLQIIKCKDNDSNN